MSTRAILLALLGTAAAYPSMSSLVPGILAARQDSTGPVLIGDLVELPEDQLTPTGAVIRGLLLGSGNPENLTSTYKAPGELGSTACSDDTCCVWSYIASELADAMKGDSGRCNDFARGAVRLGFHDAGTWSKETGKEGGGGGATGSAVLANECEDRADNNGLGETCANIRQFYDKYKGYGISMADLIQTASNVGTVVCPLGPRVRTFVGRNDVSEAAPTGLLPSPFDSVDKLLSLFGNKTISAGQLVALVGAHTTSQQRFVDTARAGEPQDSTPGVWDVEFYGETLQETSPENVFRFQSDEALARDSRTSGVWTAFTEDNNGQGPWNRAYASAYIRLSLLGVYNINDLTECTQVLPAPVTEFTSPDADALQAYVEGAIDAVKDTLDIVNSLLKGDLISL